MDTSEEQPRSNNFDLVLKELLSFQQQPTVADNDDTQHQHKNKLELVLHELLASREENMIMRERLKQKGEIEKIMKAKDEDLKRKDDESLLMRERLRQKEKMATVMEAKYDEMKFERTELQAELRKQQQQAQQRTDDLIAEMMATQENLMGKILTQQEKHERTLNNVIERYQREIDSLKKEKGDRRNREAEEPEEPAEQKKPTERVEEEIVLLSGPPVPEPEWEQQQRQQQQRQAPVAVSSPDNSGRSAPQNETTKIANSPADEVAMQQQQQQQQQ